MKAVSVGDRRLVVARSAEGIHALDNACPHQGYGLATGAFDGEMITCQWHNWKFRAADGVCVMGEEDVACHSVEVQDGEVFVTIEVPSDEEERERLWPSLERGIAKNYVGQIARDTSRLLAHGAAPTDIMARVLIDTVQRTEWGTGHETAMAADALAMTSGYDGLDRALPLTQAFSGLAETTRGRPIRREAWPKPAAQPDQDRFAAAIENEDLEQARAQLRSALDCSMPIDELRRWFITAASQHHLSYGHGAIYVQKVFELVERLDRDVHPVLLSELTVALVNSTREDLLPYMRKTRRVLDEANLEALLAVPTSEWDGIEALSDGIVDAVEPPIGLALEALAAGAGVERLLTAVLLAGSKRLLRHRLDVETDLDNDFGWLDITHVLTYANAARWAWRHAPSVDTIRLAFFAVWLAYDSGRADRRFGTIASSPVEPCRWDAPEDLLNAVIGAQPDKAVALALGNDPLEVAATIEQASLLDGAGSFIVQAHLIKLARCVAVEAPVAGSSLPLAAAARFMASPRLERFVARNVQEAVAFVRSGVPPKR